MPVIREKKNAKIKSGKWCLDHRRAGYSGNHVLLSHPLLKCLFSLDDCGILTSLSTLRDLTFCFIKLITYHENSIKTKEAYNVHMEHMSLFPFLLIIVPCRWCHYMHILLINLFTTVSNRIVPNYNMQKGDIFMRKKFFGSFSFHASFQRTFSRLIL